MFFIPFLFICLLQNLEIMTENNDLLYIIFFKSSCKLLPFVKNNIWVVSPLIND